MDQNKFEIAVLVGLDYPRSALTYLGVATCNLEIACKLLKPNLILSLLSKDPEFKLIQEKRFTSLRQINSFSKVFLLRHYNMALGTLLEIVVNTDNKPFYVLGNGWLLPVPLL